MVVHVSSLQNIIVVVQKPNLYIKLIFKVSFDLAGTRIGFQQNFHFHFL
jgi:hypothetical protein